MRLDPAWQPRLLASYPSGFPTAEQLIAFNGSPQTSQDPEQSRGLVGLVENSLSNPLFYPEGGFPDGLLAEDSPYYLPANARESLLHTYSQGRQLYQDSRLFAFVLVANENGQLINGSRNHWQPFSTLSKQQVLGKDPVEFYDTSGNRLKYQNQLLPTALSKSVGIDEFTLDILGVKTFNQFADIAIFIVPDDSLHPLAGGTLLDLTDYRLAPWPQDVADLPLVVSSSHGGGSSLISRQTPKLIEQWPDPPLLPPSYANQDNTGLVLTLSAGDQVAGIDLLDKGEQAQPLTFNFWSSSSPLLLTVGGTTLTSSSDGVFDGAVAWRHPTKKSKPGAAMEGGNGGFTAAAAMPAYQHISPWVQVFRDQSLQASLTDAWTQPDSEQLFNWWDADGQPLTLGDQQPPYRFLSGSASDSAPLAANPGLTRLMPDLANLAWQGDFLSINLAEDADLTKPDWPSRLEWHDDGGTSLASPSTAALLTAVNAQRRRQGLADLSATEVHYLLYQLPPSLLSDITSLQEQPRQNTTAYQAYPGFDFASGLGAVGGSNAPQLVQTLSSLSMPLMPERPPDLPDVLFKAGAMPLLLAHLQGETDSLQLVRMNGYAVNALLQAAQQDATVLDTGLLATLEAARKASQGGANAVAFELLPLSDAWRSADAASVVNQPLSAFLKTEGVAVAAASLIQLDRLPDIVPAPDPAMDSGMPAFYALLSRARPGEPQRSLSLRPFRRNQGALLRQGALLQTPERDSRSALVFTTLQRPLLQADVASALGGDEASTPQARIELVLRSVASRSNLYGIYAVAGPDGALLDATGRRVLPGDPGYAALALQAAVGDGSNSLLWEAPDRGTSRFSSSRDWRDPGAPTQAESLLTALKPGALYQHFVISAATPEERLAVIRALVAGEAPSAAILNQTWFALAAANSDGAGHVVGLTSAPGELLSLGFEDQRNLGDQDHNDVLATWTLQEDSFGIGSSTLADLLADRLPDLVVGSEVGSPSTVLVVATDSGDTLIQWQPFGAEDRSGVRVATGDVNGDGFDDVVTVRLGLPDGAAPGLAAAVEVLLGGRSPLPAQPQTLSFTAFGGAINGPLSLAVRDLDLDGFAEVVLSATQADPQRTSLALEVWSAAGGRFQQVSKALLPTTAALDPHHGYAVALGDLDGNGSVELVLGDQQGGDLFVASIDAGGNTPGSAIGPTVLRPYGSGFRSGVIPTVVAAQQTLVQRPEGLGAGALPWAVGDTRGSNDALLSGLGTLGALIVQSGDALDPRPSQIPLSWLKGGIESQALLTIPWDSRSGAPVFNSGGVSYLNPGTGNPPTLVQGAPLPILVSAAAGTTTVELLSGPAADASGTTWQVISDSINTLAAAGTAPQTGWTNDWSTSNDSGINTGDPTTSREQFNQVATALVSYTPPFRVNLNPLNLETPELLLADLSSSSEAYLNQVVVPWNRDKLSGETATAWGPGAPGSSNDPYGQPEPTSGPSFQPSFTPLVAAGGVDATDNLVEQFQQRLISTALTSMAINYQHHYSPLWYSALSWTNEQTPTPQLSYLTTPEGRQTQGLDCSNFSSWNYNLAFGMRLDSSVSEQAQITSVDVDWLTGESTTLQADVVKTAKDIYRDPSGASRSKDQVISYLNSILEPGDLLYIAGTAVDKDPDAATPAEAKHVITWLNDNASSDPLRFVELVGDPSPKKAFIIDSTGSESSNELGQSYPNGVQIRQFDEQAWYVNNVISVHRWLTRDNVRSMASSLIAGTATDGDPVIAAAAAEPF